MAGIDYGAVVFKNGARYKTDELYPEIDEIPIKFYKYGVYNADQSAWFCADRKFAWIVEIAGIKLRVKAICHGVFRARFRHDGSVYDVVFGYGIDNSRRVWNKIKVRYLGKKDARKVDRVLTRLGY